MALALATVAAIGPAPAAGAVEGSSAACTASSSVTGLQRVSTTTAHRVLRVTTRVRKVPVHRLRARVEVRLRVRTTVTYRVSGVVDDCVNPVRTVTTSLVLTRATTVSRAGVATRSTPRAAIRAARALAVRKARLAGRASNLTALHAVAPTRAAAQLQALAATSALMPQIRQQIFALGVLTAGDRTAGEDLPPVSSSSSSTGDLHAIEPHAAPTTSGDLTAADLPARLPGGLEPVVDQGGAEVGFQGNGTHVRGRDLATVLDALRYMCGADTSANVRATAALQGTYGDASGRRRANVLLLELATPQAAAVVTQDARNCAGGEVRLEATRRGSRVQLTATEPDSS